MRLDARRRRIAPLLAAALAAWLGGCTTAGTGVPGEVAISAYGGAASSGRSDLRLERTDGTSVTLADVDWKDESDRSPPFYGVRLGYWFGEDPRWGVNLDFTHAKAIVNTTQVVDVSGTTPTGTVDGRQPIATHLDSFELSHGLNFLTFNVVRRWFPKGKRDGSFGGRLQPYLGGGVGLAIPHVEAMVDGERTSEYQAAGPTLQFALGCNVDVAGPVSAFLEYKLNWADLRLDLAGDTQVRTSLLTHQYIVGLTFRF